MPALTTDLNVLVCQKARDVPDFVLESLQLHEVNANVILPTLIKCCEKENSGGVIKDHLWIVVYKNTGDSFEVKVVVSCTDGLIGKYPIFLFSPLPSDSHQDRLMLPSLTLAARELFLNVSPRRVYSVFGPEVLSRTFAGIWTTNTNIQLAQDPYYYSCKISYLTLGTLIEKELPLASDQTGYLRPAVQTDVEGVARLNFLFAADAQPFILTKDKAYAEAEASIRNNFVWVHTLGPVGGPQKIVSIVVFTRNSERVATITKVFTDPDTRRGGCAERLLRRVCKYLLNDLGKEKIALFVGITNDAATVYKRVGFVGIGKGAAPAQGVDTWEELGFDRSQVDLGHW